MDEYCDALVRDAMGRLFWSFERAMKTDCLAIIMALEGQGEFLRELFGASKQAAPAVQSPPPMTQGAFSQMFRKAA